MTTATTLQLDAEVSRRLAMAYDLIIQCVRKKRAVEGDEVGRPDPSTAGDAPTQEPGAQGDYTL